MRPAKLSEGEIQAGIFQQTHYRWLYTWSRHHGDVYVEDNITGDRFLWIPVNNSLGKMPQKE